jgi:uncharacterized membrane protein
VDQEERGERDEPRSGVYGRDTDPLEFGRLAAFSDALFAIAMTLLVVGITVPDLTRPDDPRALWEALHEQGPAIFSFALSFVVVGYYWVAHHRFVAQLAGVDRALLGFHLPYLGLVALLPFPTAVLGRYESNPVSVAAYALVVALISTLEWVLLWHARRAGLLRIRVPGPLFRWATITSLLPATLFLVSVPLAFVSVNLAYGAWVANLPAQFLLNRTRPETLDGVLR